MSIIWHSQDLGGARLLGDALLFTVWLNLCMKETCNNFCFIVIRKWILFTLSSSIFTYDAIITLWWEKIVKVLDSINWHIQCHTMAVMTWFCPNQFCTVQLLPLLPHDSFFGGAGAEVQSLLHSFWCWTLGIGTVLDARLLEFHFINLGVSCLLAGSALCISSLWWYNFWPDYLTRLSALTMG